MMRSALLLPLIFAPVVALAEAPALQNTGRIIYLADNLDEADLLGYCIDTQDRGQTERIQLHSCKPDSGNAQNRDVLFALNAETSRIEHQEYTGFCLTADPNAASTVFALVTCSDAEDQKFTFDNVSGHIHPADDETMCLTSGADSKQAGPYMSRPLALDTCGAVDAVLQRFVMQ